MGRVWEALLAATVAATLAGMLLAARRGGPAGWWRSAGAVGIVACVAAGGVFVSPPHLPAHRDAVARRHADAPETDPLSRLPRWTGAPSAPVLHARFTGAPGAAGRLWPLLAYGTYRGGTGWQSSPALTALPAGSAGTGVDVVLAHAERLVPHPFGVRSARPAGTGYDPRTEAVRTPAAGTAYSLTLDVTPRTTAGAPLAVPPSTGCAGPELRRLVDRVHRQLPVAGQLAELAQVVAGAGSADATGPVEDGCDGVTAALREGHGTSDQYATAFALAARMLGASSRVVAGFAPRRQVAADGGLDILGGDAVAWPQIAYGGGLWVDYWPLPGRTAAGGHVPSPEPAAATPPDAGSPGGGSAWPGHAASLLFLAAGAALLLSAAAAGAVVLRARRAERLRDRARMWDELSPRQRILSLWARSLRDSGTPPSPSTTARDVGAATGLPPLRELAQLVDRTLYAPAAPQGTAEAEQAARLAAAVRAGAGADRRRGRRRLSSRRPPC
ncbi:transglutaminase domain-containing protein [Actinacidiphila paucisporea]|uniref:Transglutaminase-like superfamily protein n=1 Tax=Actinacidiphila paucisporea TaxID=310782 RepID=A0A1M7E7V8_9ACTN|nr:transglutaminase-like domain-containing protein [Actinacidiphila paucisporea]SHL87736.1 Transglutaminase-like superfamily protein [Actinacidiphila paucisporea]